MMPVEWTTPEVEYQVGDVVKRRLPDGTMEALVVVSITDAGTLGEQGRSPDDPPILPTD